nr:flavin reductase family protein [Marinactinospora thermotolerans]
MDTPPPPALPHDGHIDVERFRHALALHAAGVTAITARVGGVPIGLTATSFTGVSAEPPLVSFCVATTSTTWPRLRRATGFAVALLADDQHDLATRFATRGADRFAEPTRWSSGPEGVPVLDGAVAHLFCVPHERLLVGDHWLVVGRVVETLLDPSKRPLLYFRRAFGAFSPRTA